MAYHLRRMVSGLHLYSAGRQPAGIAADDMQLIGGLASDRYLAREHLELSSLGPVSLLPNCTGKVGAGTCLRPAQVSVQNLHASGNSSELVAVCGSGPPQIGVYFSRLFPFFGDGIAVNPSDFIRYGKQYGLFLLLGFCSPAHGRSEFGTVSAHLPLGRCCACCYSGGCLLYGRCNQRSVSLFQF